MRINNSFPVDEFVVLQDRQENFKKSLTVCILGVKVLER